MNRHELNKRARRLDHLEARILRAIGSDALTPAEVCDRIPAAPAKDVRRALLVLRDAGALDRITDSTSVIYAATTEVVT